MINEKDFARSKENVFKSTYAPNARQLYKRQWIATRGVFLCALSEQAKFQGSDLN